MTPFCGDGMVDSTAVGFLRGAELRWRRERPAPDESFRRAATRPRALSPGEGAAAQDPDPPRRRGRPDRRGRWPRLHSPARHRRLDRGRRRRRAPGRSAGGIGRKHLRDRLGRGVQWTVVGESGATSRDLLERYLEPATSAEHDVVFVTVGANDALKLPQPHRIRARSAPTARRPPRREPRCRVHRVVLPLRSAASRASRNRCGRPSTSTRATSRMRATKSSRRCPEW